MFQTVGGLGLNVACIEWEGGVRETEIAEQTKGGGAGQRYRRTVKLRWWNLDARDVSL